MRIIGMDSSGTACSVAVLADGILAAEYTVTHKKTHSQTLLPMLSEILAMCELDGSEADAIAIAAGPGSFTGLRIGSATAKGLAYAWNVPIIPVPTTAGLAYNAFGFPGIICPIMDARRNQVYNGLYTFRGEELVTLTPERAIGISDLVRELESLYQGQEVVFLGDGIGPFREEIDRTLSLKHIFMPGSLAGQHAGSVAALGEQYLKRGITEDAVSHAPIYLRASQAEREREEVSVAKQMILRPMEEKDLPAVAGIEADSFPDPWSEKSFAESMLFPEYRMFVAELSGHVLGFVVTMLSGEEAEIATLAVKPGYRERGAAKKMLKDAIEALQKEGIRRFLLEVRVSNAPARHLYDSLGFTEDGIRPHFYENPAEDAVLMSLSLPETTEN